jgi:hypothetical protein
MNSMTHIRKYIRKAAKQGDTLKQISSILGISTGAIDRIIKGAYPDAKNAKILDVPAKCILCKRTIPKPKVKAAPPLIGRDPNWFDYFIRRFGK